MLDALDPGGRVVDRDWVGQHPSGAPKPVARLRAAGIDEVRWTPVPGQPPVQRTETKWVLSEDYCRGEGWTEAGEHWFVADPEFHDASQVKTHYLPFRASFDPDKVADAIGNLLLATPEIKELFQPGQDVYAMVSRTAAFAEDDDPRAGEMRASLLQALIASGVDPVMARILGLYGFVDAATADDKRRGDVLIEAELPFFDQANLEAIDQRLKTLLPEAGSEFFRNAGYFLEGQRLSALILAAGLEKRPEMDKPLIQPTEVSVAAVPAQAGDPLPQILVQTRTDVALDPFEVRPELTPVAYLVERQVSGGPYQNVAEGEGPADPLDEIGLLPAVYFPARQDTAGAAPLRVADDFVLPDLSPATVQYRLTAFDVFGRPSAPVESDKVVIDPPVLPPAAPVGPAARIAPDAGRLMLELDFSLAGVTPPLEAPWSRLEVTVHRLPPGDPLVPDPRLPGEVTWSGTVAARRLAAAVLAGNELNLALAASCLSLAWTPALTATPAAETVCAPLYPPPPELLAIDPASATFADTGLRSYRLRLAVGTEDGVPPGAYRWAARLVTIGQNPFTAAEIGSAEVCVAADWMVHPPPPAVTPPVTSVVPVSSYPDGNGDSWFELDLGAWGLASGDRVNVYLTRLGRLGDVAAGLVVDGVLQDQTLLTQIVRTSRRPFELENREPVQLSPATRFHRIKVAGNLREVYVLAVVGTNAYLQERPWSAAGVALFATPDRRPEPRLSFVRSIRPVAGTATFDFAADFAEVPEAAHPPKVQLVRRDLSAQGRSALMGEAVGATMAPAPGSATRFGFELSDAGQENWHDYEYEAQLLSFDPLSGRYLRGRGVARALGRGGWDGQATPFRPTEALSVVMGAPTGLVVAAEFDCGEFDLVLVRSVAGKVASRFAGRLRQGRLFGLDPATASLEPVRRDGRDRCRLTVHDTDAAQVAPPDGAYVFRLAYGEAASWSLREGVPA